MISVVELLGLVASVHLARAGGLGREACEGCKVAIVMQRKADKRRKLYGFRKRQIRGQVGIGAWPRRKWVEEQQRVAGTGRAVPRFAEVELLVVVVGCGPRLVHVQRERAPGRRRRRQHHTHGVVWVRMALGTLLRRLLRRLLWLGILVLGILVLGGESGRLWRLADLSGWSGAGRRPISGGVGIRLTGNRRHVRHVLRRRVGGLARNIVHGVGVLLVVVDVRRRRGSRSFVVHHQIAQQVQQQAALDVHEQQLVVLLELPQQVTELPHRQVLVVGGQRQRVQHLVEAVHVELAHKRRYIAVLEVVQERIRELLGRVEREGVGVVRRRPPDKVSKVGVREHTVKFVDKGILFDRRVGVFGRGHVGMCRKSESRYPGQG